MSEMSESRLQVQRVSQPVLYFWFGAAACARWEMQHIFPVSFLGDEQFCPG